ncbi:MAG: hypothetical protein OXR73_28825 [Myxococcales bacterium]|nr:hypothetical protein [Myxococcales bacterium]
MKASVNVVAVSAAFVVLFLMAAAFGILFADSPHPMRSVAEQGSQ